MSVQTAAERVCKGYLRRLHSLLSLKPCIGLSGLELRAKGGRDALYAAVLATVIIAAGAVWLPLMHWLMDHRGYGTTLIFINTFGVVASIMEVRGATAAAHVL